MLHNLAPHLPQITMLKSLKPILKQSELQRTQILKHQRLSKTY